MFEQIKTFIVVSLSSLAAYLSPINGILFSVSFMFAINFIVGYTAGMRVNKEDFSFQKAFSCIKEVCVFFVVAASAYVIGDKMDNKDGAIQAISVVTYSLIYFYSVNVFKNLKRLFPNSQWIAFTYYCISFEMVKKVSFMEAFLKQKKEIKNEQECTTRNQE